MSDWKANLFADPTDWLLEDENPSVRYYALTDLLDLPQDDPAVIDAKARINSSSLVREILDKMADPVYVAAFPRFYTYKYEGLVWQLILLAELGVQAGPQIASYCEYILTHAQETQYGGFSQSTAVKTGGGRINEVVPCLSGNMLFCLLRFGFGDDPRVRKGFDWIDRFMRLNDGIETDPQVAPYAKYDMCWGRHTCHMLVVKALKAFAALPAERRTAQDAATLAKAAEFMLIHHVHKRSHDLSKKSKPGWLKFGFPLMYQTDALEILDILTSLGIADERMEEAICVVRDKQDADGRWRLENNYAGERLLVPMGAVGGPDKWITLRAMRVLKRWHELRNGV